MMIALLFNRIAGCTAGYVAVSMLFGLPLTPWDALWSIGGMVLLFVFLRPLAALVLLPLNTVLCGIPGLLVDALFVWWMAGEGFGYGASLLAAMGIALVYELYLRMRIRHFAM